MFYCLAKNCQNSLYLIELNGFVIQTHQNVDWLNSLYKMDAHFILFIVEFTHLRILNEIPKKEFSGKNVEFWLLNLVLLYEIEL